MGGTSDTFAQNAAAPEKMVLNLCWYQERVGQFEVSENGVKWLGFSCDAMEAFFGDVLPTREKDGMPQFLANIGPENAVFRRIGIDNQGDYLKTGLRFPSNTVVSANAPMDHPVPNDYLQVEFEDYINDKGVFTGHYLGRPPKSLKLDELADEIAPLWKNRHLPRYSGKEMKLPVTLHEEGEVQKAIGSSFTHFLKLPNEGPQEGWGVNEWMCMQLCEASGLPTAKHALIEIDENMPPAYLVERFDINSESRRGSIRRFIQDFCTLAGMRPLIGGDAIRAGEGLTVGTMEKIAKTMKQYSTDIQSDLENLFKRTLVSIAVGDNDMHRKNLSMLFRYDVNGRKVETVNMSPAYDITSEIFAPDDQMNMCIPLAGKQRNFARKNLIVFGKSIGLDAARAEEIIDETFTKIAARAVEIANDPPEIAVKNEVCAYTVGRIATIAVNNARKMGCDVPDWQPQDIISPERFEKEHSSALDKKPVMGAPTM